MQWVIYDDSEGRIVVVKWIVLYIVLQERVGEVALWMIRRGEEVKMKSEEVMNESYNISLYNLQRTTCKYVRTTEKSYKNNEKLHQFELTYQVEINNNKQIQ